MAKFTPQQLDKLYHQALAEFAASPEKWQNFLDTAARLYKYDFKSQVLIWSQRPDATACADMELWNGRMHRRVNRGSSGIAVIDDRSAVKYLFDVADTSPTAPTVAPPYIWQMRNDAHDTVLDGISAALGEDMHMEFDFPVNLYLSAQCFADRKGSKYTDNTNLLRVAAKSTAYSVLQRSGFDPSQYITDIDISQLSPNELSLVGQITQEASETALRSIEQTMKNLDGCKLFRFTTQKRIAEQRPLVYNKDTERVSAPTEKGSVVNGNTFERGYVSRRGARRQDVSGRRGTGLRNVGTEAPALSENRVGGRVLGTDSQMRSEPSSEQDRTGSNSHVGRSRKGEREAARSDRGAEEQRPNDMDRSDEQLQTRSGESGRGTRNLLKNESAAEPGKPAAVAFEQMSLTDAGGSVFQSNTQPAASASNVFDWNTSDVSDDVINSVLTVGSNSTHSRERIAAFFMQPNVSAADAAAFLRREYRVGGKGVRVHNIDHSVWFDGTGMRIACGQDTRTPRAAVLTYEDAANRISTLLRNGQYATASELSDAKPNEYRELAEEIWYIYRDISEEAREQGFFTQTSALANGVFPSAVEELTAALNDPSQRAVLTDEMAGYAHAVQQNRDLCRFRFNVQRSEDAAERLQRTEHMTTLYAAADGFEPTRAAFITQDEIDQLICSGSGVEHGKKRISEFYAEKHTQKERIEFLKNEYGWGGRSFRGYSENHDGKGIVFERSDADGVYDKVTLSWSQVDHLIGTLIRQHRYLTPAEQKQYEQARLEALAVAEPQPESVFQSNTHEVVVDDDFSDINPAEVREALARNGIVNGEVVEPEKLNSNPFIQQVMSDVESASQNDVFQSNTQKQQAPVDTLNDYNSIKLNASYADSIVLFQVGDFFEMFGEDAKQAAALLELNLTTRELPGIGRVEMCGIPAHSLERYVEKLRDKHDVTIAATKNNSTERHVYTMRSIDHEAEDAVNAYETEFGADGLRAFRDTSAETQANVFQSNTPETPDTDRFEIYQLKDDPVNAKLLFSSYSMVHADGMTINRNNYELKYSAPLTPETTLDSIYMDFNIDRPADFTGHSLSVSDIVVLHRNGQDTAHYVDSIGFADVPEFLTEQTQENVFQRNTPPERDVFEGNSPAERAELAASDPDNDVFQGNTLNEAAESTEAHTADLQTAKQLINDYCKEELDTDADFSDLSDVHLAYSTTEDNEHEIQISADLTAYSINYAVDNEVVHSIQCDSLHELNEHLANLDFSEMISDAEYNYYQLHPENKSDTVFRSNTQMDNTIMVRCEWSESSVFEDGKLYPLAEFDRLMREADENFVSTREAIEREYGSLQNACHSGYDTAYKYSGYDKTMFTILMPDGKAYTERQDIGDGYGGLLDYLSQFSKYQEILPMLREAVDSTRKAADVFQSNTQEPTAPETADVFQSNTPLYKVGDTVYLDNKPFEITDIRDFHVELHDPSLLYPIARIENRDNFTQLLALDERNAAFISAEPEPEQVVVTEVNMEAAVTTAELDVLRPQLAAAGIDYAVSNNSSGHTISFSRDDAGEVQKLLDALPDTPEHPSAQSFRITDDALGTGTLGEKFERNIAAIRLLKSLEAANRPATAEEQQVLSQYVGWGGMANAFSPSNRRYDELRSTLTEDEYKAARASVLNSHYTAPAVIRAMYDAVGQMGFNGGRVLEPSMGVGNFFGMLPENMAKSQLTGVELDSISGRIARKLYPNADIKITGYENTKFADNSFDVAIGNVPFGDYKLPDRRYDKDHLLIHDYFFVKTLDKVRPGGIVAFITSKGTLDKVNPAARQLMAERADLLGAIRLPNNAFKANAGTNVTSDILFLQKRGTPPEQMPSWTETGKTADGMVMNRYFVQHPEMILGTMQEVTTQFGMDTACVPLPDANLSDLLKQAVHDLGHENVFQSNTQIVDDVFQSNTQNTTAQETADVFRSNTQTDALRPYSYTVQDGKLLFKTTQNELVAVKKNAKATQRAIGMIPVRDSARRLIEAQRDGCDDEQLHALQTDLNREYDAFVSKFENFHKQGNKLAFNDDASYPLLLALEQLDDEENVTGKAAIFSKRTISPHIEATHADSPEDALALSLTERGKIDLDYMSSLLSGMTQEQITSALRQQIFRDPETNQWQAADEYLSGNVRAKLDVARAAAQADPSFTINVKKLEEVQPEPLTAADIEVRLGTTWIPPKDIERFIYEVIRPPYYAARKIKVKYSPEINRWRIEGKSEDQDPRSLALTKYGTTFKMKHSGATGCIRAYDLLELALNLRDAEVSEKVMVNGKEEKRILPEATFKARAAQDALRQAFKDWIFADPERRERLVGYYNEHFNTMQPRKFDGSHLTFPGINPEIKLHDHQRNAVARVLYGGNTLLAHCVGAGKTWTIAAAAMELRRLGLANKPMIVVPKPLTEQWGAEFQQLYPGANILVATEKDFSTQNRKAFCARIATGDYDAVILGHTQFEMIPLSTENQQKHIEKRIENLETSIITAKQDRNLSFSVKRLESEKRKLQTKLETLMNAKEKDNVLTFEELGVDHLFVDEADEFKNLSLETKMSNVAGITSTAAIKSEDMMAKCEYLNEKTNYRGICFATGTPISNSMSELYTNMRYLQSDVLEKAQLSSFDAWASVFGETVTAMELAPEGYNLYG